MARKRTEERGFALAGAVFALVIVGALVTAGFFAVSQETRIGYSTQYAADAFFAAERGLNELVGSMPMSFYDDNVAVDAIVKPAAYQAVQVVSDGVETEYSVSVRGLGDRLYYVESTGRVTGGGRYGGASRRTAMVVRTVDLDFGAEQALMTYGGVNFQGAAEVSGLDDDPSGWTGCAVGTDVPGVLAKDSTTIDTQANTDLFGDPAIDEEPGMTADDFIDYGGLDYDKLAAMADDAYQIPGGAVVNTTAASYFDDGSCNTFDGNNWGTPTNQGSACAEHFPLIHANGDVTINSNARGQGILLVDGDLKLGGGFEFYGIVIVKGKLEIGSGGAEIHGAALVLSDADITNVSDFAGNPNIQFSSCAVERAVAMNAVVNRAFPIGDRSWVDLTATGALTY
ncbi:MAG TPA: pilus assembly PilX N-terminal domain-containing protein [Longimicrobiales bacterium]|nr:pilus assembly PilX N-terminal domain-containing protein [Longimicrobiales bacterium]